MKYCYEFKCRFDCDGKEIERSIRVLANHYEIAEIKIKNYFEDHLLKLKKYKLIDQYNIIA